MYLFRTLLPERRIEREEEHGAEIKRGKLLVSRSVARTQREIWGERGRERPREKEDKLLRLDKGQNSLSAPVMANTNRPLLISLYLLCPPFFHAACFFPLISLLPCPPFPSLLTYVFPSFPLLLNPSIPPLLVIYLSPIQSIPHPSLPSLVPKSRPGGATARPQSSASRLHQPGELPGCTGGGMALWWW